MGIKEGQYFSFSMLEERVIKKAVEEINKKTDILIEYDVERLGRSVESLIFRMKLKKGRLNLFPDNTEITKKLQALGVHDWQIKKLLKNHTEQYLLLNIAVIEKRLQEGKKIDDIPAYLMKAFQNNYQPKETEYTKIKKEKKAVKQHEREEIEKIELERIALKWRYEEERNMEFTRLEKQLTKEETKTLKTEFENEIKQKEFLGTKYAAKWFDHFLIQTQRRKFLIEKLLPIELHTFENYQASKLQVEQSTIS